MDCWNAVKGHGRNYFVADPLGRNNLSGNLSFVAGSLMFILRLEPPIPLMTPRGDGMAIIFRDMGIECHDLWTVIQSDGGIWTWENPQVRAQSNVTLGRKVEP